MSATSPTVYRSLWFWMRGHRLRYGAAVLALLLSVYFSFQVPLVIADVIDAIFREGAADREPSRFVKLLLRVVGSDGLRRHLWLPGLLMVGLMLVAGGFSYLRGLWIAQASESIIRAMRERIYDHLQHLPVAFHAAADTGDLVQRSTSDVETVRNFLGGQVTELGRGIIMLIVLIPIMLTINWVMTLYALSLTPLIILASLFFFSRIKAAFKEQDEAEAAMTTVLQENLTGIRVVRAFARQEHEIAKFQGKNAAYRDLQYRVVCLMAWYWPSSDLMCLAQTGFVLVVGARFVQHDALSVGQLFFYMACLGMLLWGPLRNMGRVLVDMGKAQVAIGRIEEILREPRESGPARPVALPAEMRGEIEFDRVSFAYQDGQPVLHEVSFRVEPGQTFAILGPTGSGKSTLVSLLLRFHDPAAGAIRIDGVDIGQAERKAVRARIGVVLQEPFLYSKTLRDNIRFGHSEAPRERIEAAAIAACVHDNILDFEKGYETEIGERGVTLSGGQRQRVALARAIVKDPPILILDDALSAVDTHTERLILRALADRHGRKTTILIAHRLSTLMHADRILVLDHGRVIQTGSHAELVNQEGLYRRLWSIQTSLQQDLAGDPPAPAAEARAALAQAEAPTHV